jgi:hypothetical protein
MKRVWKWILLGIAVFLAAFFIALPLLGGWGVMPVRGIYGYGLIHRGMTGWGGFSWIGMLFRFAVPALLVVGGAGLVYYLVKPPAAPPANPVPTKPCGACGKPLDPGWVACPYCGKKQPK